MSVISNRQKALDQLLHKDNIADCVVKGKIVNAGEAKEVSIGRKEMESRTAIMHTPEDIKVLAGALYMVEGSRIASEVSGLGQHHTRLHAKGLSTRVKFDEELAEKVLDKKEELAAPIRDKALKVILNAIEVCTPEKLEQAKLREAAGVAKDMAAVYEKLGDKNAGNGSAISFHFHAPRERKENEYVIKDV
jgi:hypothetical protein